MTDAWCGVVWCCQNPLVQIFSQVDLDKFKQSSADAPAPLPDKHSSIDGDDGDVDDVLYVCHSSFGNEAMESLLRQPILVPRDLAANANNMVRWYVMLIVCHCSIEISNEPLSKPNYPIVTDNPHTISSKRIITTTTTTTTTTAEHPSF